MSLHGHPLRRVLVTFRVAALFGIVGLVLLGLAIAVATHMYGRCGASALEAADAACRLGVRLLFSAYALLSVALVLGAISLTLLWCIRRARRRERE